MKIVRYTPLALIVVSLVGCATNGNESGSRRFESAVLKIEQGMPIERLLELLGEPNKVVRGTDRIDTSEVWHYETKWSEVNSVGSVQYSAIITQTTVRIMLFEVKDNLVVIGIGDSKATIALSSEIL